MSGTGRQAMEPKLMLIRIMGFMLSLNTIILQPEDMCGEYSMEKNMGMAIIMDIQATSLIKKFTN